MSTTLHLYHSPYINAFYNLALEEHLLRSRQEGNMLLFWRSANTVVIGRHQNLIEEINLPYLEQNNIAVVRRSTGGGAVYHDTGNVNFSFISSNRQSSSEAMHFFTRPVIEALAEFGIQAELSGRNDIMVGDKKISGNAQMLLGRRMLHHGTILYNTNLTKLADVLKVRPEKFTSKSTKSVRSRVGNIVDFLENPPSVEQFIDQLMQYTGMTQGAYPLELSSDDKKSIEGLRRDKYETWNWNYGRSPQSTLKKTQHFSGGMLEIYLKIAQGQITECTFYGDYMALRPTEEFASILLGVPFTLEHVQSRIEKFAQETPLEEYFGSITLNEILCCLFANE